MAFKGINCPISKKTKFTDSKTDTRRKSKAISNSNLLFEKFSETHIRSLFLDFILGLFEAYDETKHYTIDADNDVNLCIDKFIDDSKSDIRNLLSLIIKERPVI